MQTGYKLTETDVTNWIKQSYVYLHMFDTPNVYIHRYKKISYFKRFFVNFNVKTGKLLVYIKDERESKKQVLFVATNTEDIKKKSLYEIYNNIPKSTTTGR